VSQLETIFQVVICDWFFVKIPWIASLRSQRRKCQKHFRQTEKQSFSVEKNPSKFCLTNFSEAKIRLCKQSEAIQDIVII